MKHPPVTTLDDIRPGTVYRLTDVVAVLPIDRSTVYRHVAAGAIAATRLGGVWLVLGAEVRRACGAGAAPPEPTETVKQRQKRAAAAVARMRRAKT